jgi:hypothetical protein
MWRDTARDYFDLPILILPLCAPLSRPMVEHLVLLELQQYRRAVISSWPAREEVWQRILERVQHARTDVGEYMDVFVADDIKRATEEGQERAFPDDEWILEQLASYAPANAKMTQKALEGWQSRNILRREHTRGRWRLDDVAVLLIMRIANVTHQKGWLPSEIPDNESRWWAFGKSAPDAPIQETPIPLRGVENTTPLLLWTPYDGASWAGNWQRVAGVSVRWSRPFATANELAVWHTKYADEIQRITQRSAEVSASEWRLSQDGMLMLRPTVQTAVRTSIEQVMREIQTAMLREAEQLILEEQAQIISKEK